MVCVLGVYCGTPALFGQSSSSATLAWNPSTSPGIAGYRLYQGGAKGVYTNIADVGAATTAKVSGLVQGRVYFFAVTAYDLAGLESTYSNELTFSPSNAAPPAVVLTSPAAGASFVAPATLNLSATVTTNGHSITKVRFFSGSSLLGERGSPPYSFAWANVGVGSYTLSATVVYHAGSTGVSPAVNVSVTAPPGTGITMAAPSGVITAPFVSSNGMVVQSIQTAVNNGGRATYAFNLTSTGDYLILASVQAPNEGANSLYVNIDAEPTDPLMVWDIPVATSFSDRTVSWGGLGTNAKVFNLTAGAHQLIVRGREPNTAFRSFTIYRASVLPAPWQALDIGVPGLTGTGAVSNGVYRVGGAGNLGGYTDNFRFLYQPITGDGEIRAQLVSLQDTGSAARAGVMIRETLNPGSRYVWMGLSPDGTFRSQRRNKTSGATTSTLSASGPMPNTWVRVVRNGNSFSTYKSTDGVNLTRVSSYSINMANGVYMGLAVASGSTNSVDQAVFSAAVGIP